jgi:hypothetical protein
MRIRQVKPSFFKDARMAELPAPVRLTYIGLWMLADDAGYYRWDVAEAGLELYGYESRTKRERDVAKHLEALVKAGRVTDLGCGHVLIPTLTDHQRFGGPTKRVTTYQREHADCPRIPATPRDSPPIPDTVRNGTERYGDGTERSGTVDARKRDDETESDFKARVGIPAFMGGTVQ